MGPHIPRSPSVAVAICLGFPVLASAQSSPRSSSRKIDPALRSSLTDNSSTKRVIVSVKPDRARPSGTRSSSTETSWLVPTIAAEAHAGDVVALAGHPGVAVSIDASMSAADDDAVDGGDDPMSVDCGSGDLVCADAPAWAVTAQGPHADIVWGTLDFDNIVWATWDSDNIVWGTTLPAGGVF